MLSQVVGQPAKHDKRRADLDRNLDHPILECGQALARFTSQVAGATEDYLDTEDAMGNWLAAAS